MEAVASKQPEHDESDLKRMSFGDHLEELRRRLFLSLLAVGVSVLVLVPFKETVTSVYVEPYHAMWGRFFAGYVDQVDSDVVEAKKGLATATDPQDRQLRQEELELLTSNYDWLQRYAPSILAGTYNFDRHSDKIRTEGGFQLNYALMATGGLDDFWTFMTASFLFALILSSPFVLYQAWAFIAAGLYRHERGVVMKYLPLSAFLLISGVTFGYLVVVPYGLFFLVKLMNFSQVQPMLTVSQYFSLLFTMTAALGFVFQLPLVMLAIQKIGLVTHEGFRKHWRYIVIGIFVLSAALTPPDPFTQIMMGIPMCTLYAFGLLLTYRSDKKLRRAGPETV